MPAAAIWSYLKNGATRPWQSLTVRMGTLRVILVLSFVGWNIDGRYVMPVTGHVALICFYIISGFTISMVIHENYRHVEKGVWRFYAARFLRVFPIYWTVCLLTLIFWLVIRGAKPVVFFNLDLPPGIWLPTLIANFAIFGLDALAMAVQTTWKTTNILQLIPPAWSLAIALQFYLVAPFIVTRSLRFLIGAFLALLLVRAAFLGLHHEPWRSYFAPTVWCFFILGVLAHRLIRPRPESAAELGAVAAVVLLGAVAITGTSEAKDIDRPELWLFYLLFAAGIPLIFAWTKRVQWDDEIGQLAYPLFLVHPLVIVAVARSQEAYRSITELHWSWHVLALLISIIAAVAIYCLVGVPTEWLRSRVKRRRSASGE